MGTLRVVGIVVITFFLTLFLLGAVVSYSGLRLTSTDVLKPAVSSIVLELLEERGLDIDGAYDELIEECESSTDASLSEDDVEIDCEELKAVGKTGLMDLFVDTFMEQIDTITESEGAEDAMPFGATTLFGDKNKQYLKYSLAGFLVLAGLSIAGIVLLAKPKHKALIPVGIAGLFFVVPYGLLFIANSKLGGIESEAIRGLASSALGIIRTNVLIVAIAGAVLLGAGVVLSLALKKSAKVVGKSGEKA